MTAVQRGGGLQSAVNVPPGGLGTAAPLADASVPAAVQRGGGLQSAVNVRSGGLKTAAPLASPRYFDPNVEIDIHGSRLPHWDQSSTLCFVTFRLADSLPQEKLAGFVARRDAWISVHPRPWDEQTTVEYASEFGDQLETWLDAGYGACILQDSQVRGVVEDSLLHFNGERYILDAFVVMPNHVHALFAPMLGQNIAGIVKTWKSFSARRINALRGISGPLWQRNYWDTLIRNAKHHRRVRKYIFDNSPTLARISQRGGGLQSAVNVPPGGLETAAPLADASLSTATSKRGGGLQSAVKKNGGLETTSPLADAHLI